MDGAEVTTDTTWGGSFFREIQPGKTVTAVINYGSPAHSVMIMIDSFEADATGLGRAGGVTFGNFTFSSSTAA